MARVRRQPTRKVGYTNAIASFLSETKIFLAIPKECIYGSCIVSKAPFFQSDLFFFDNLSGRQGRVLHLWPNFYPELLKNRAIAADFYTKDTDGLRCEGSKSLQVYLAMCKEKFVEPYKSYSGKFTPELHAAAVTAATAKGQSLNKFVSETIEEHIELAKVL